MYNKKCNRLQVKIVLHLIPYVSRSMSSIYEHIVEEGGYLSKRKKKNIDRAVITLKHYNIIRVQDDLLLNNKYLYLNQNDDIGLFRDVIYSYTNIDVIKKLGEHLKINNYIINLFLKYLLNRHNEEHKYIYNYNGLKYKDNKY